MFSFVFGGIDFAHKLDQKKKPSENYEKHLHYFYEIVFFVRGKVNYHVEGESRRLNNGDLVFIGAARNHFAEVNPEESYERYVLKFDESLVAPSIRKRLRDIRVFHTAAPSIISIFSELDEYYGAYSIDEMAVLFRCELEKLLVFLLNDKQEISGEYNEDIAKIVEWIDVHIEEPISLERVASTFHYSPSQICNSFKRYAKMSIMRMIKTKKLIAARKAIESGQKKNEVAIRYSFENYSTFYRLYVKTFGESPSGIKKS